MDSINAVAYTSKNSITKNASELEGIAVTIQHTKYNPTSGFYG